MTMDSTRPQRSRRARLAVASTLVVAAAVVAYLVLSGNGNVRRDVNTAAARVPRGSAVVERRDLITDDTENGTITHTGSFTVDNRLSGTVTWLPHAGAVIKPGQPLFDVNNLPVILMAGHTPAYRNLNRTDPPGPDILELNADLISLGYDPDYIVDNDTWQPATTAGVKELQATLGLGTTGGIKLGRIDFMPGKQRVSSVVGSVGTGVSLSMSSAPKPDFVSLETPVADPQAKAHAEVQAAETKAKAEVQAANQRAAAAMEAAKKAKADAARHAQHLQQKTQSESEGSPTAILDTTSTRLIVTVDLSPGSQSEAKVGHHVQVQLPNGRFVRGTVRSVGTATSSSSSAGTSDTSDTSDSSDDGSDSSSVPVTISLDKHVSGRGLDQAVVDVTFVKARRNNVLSVPVTALVAVPGRHFALQEATPPHKLIPVRTGMFATGFVQVSGRGIHPGLHVTDSQG